MFYRPLPPPPCHTNQIRWLDPVLPCCPPPCSPREIRRPVTPEPPPIPFCPVLPPCSCPAIPLICHNSCRYFRPTSLCDKAKDTSNPLVCYVPKDRTEVVSIFLFYNKQIFASHYLIKASPIPANRVTNIPRMRIT